MKNDDRACAEDGVARARAPGPSEIERRFRSRTVRFVRPVILGGIGVLGTVRGFRWQHEGGETLAESEPPVIFAANHNSHADTAAILGTLPRRIRRRTCVAAALDVFGPTAVGEKRTLKVMQRECLEIIVAAGFHAFAFDRHGPPLPSLRTAVTLLRRGWSLLLYPEGTRSRSGDLGVFKAGVGVLARSTGRPIIPVHVSGGQSILPCGATIPRAGVATVHYGAPLHHRRGESATELVARLRQRIGELAPPEMHPETHPVSQNGTAHAPDPAERPCTASRSFSSPSRP